MQPPLSGVVLVKEKVVKTSNFISKYLKINQQIPWKWQKNKITSLVKRILPVCVEKVCVGLHLGREYILRVFQTFRANKITPVPVFILLLQWVLLMLLMESVVSHQLVVTWLHLVAAT